MELTPKSNSTGATQGPSVVEFQVIDTTCVDVHIAVTKEQEAV